MATFDMELLEPPLDPRQRELWLQRGAGLILFEDVRGHAREKVDPNLSDEARQAAIKGIDDAVYGLMMVIDGVSGVLRGNGCRLSLRVIARLEHVEPPELVEELDLLDGEGMSIGYHGWIESDFGDTDVAIRRA